MKKKLSTKDIKKYVAKLGNATKLTQGFGGPWLEPCRPHCGPGGA